jgi:putative PIN family toxin of toxin-antitoxin system
LKIVLDANTIISAYFWNGKPYKVVERVLDGFDVLFVTDDILTEIEETIRKPKFETKQEQVITIITALQVYGQKITVHPEYRVSGVCRHPKDDKYLECAIAAQADCVISGDNHLLEIGEYKGIKIINASQYLEIVNP